MTQQAAQMIREWLAGNYSEERIEQVARYMSKTLRIGGLKACRELVLEVANG